MANKIGGLIKEARTDAGLTQKELAKKLDGVSAQDISDAENGKKALSQAALKQIAKATGVTQSSLLEAAKKSTYKDETSSGKKTASSKSSKKTMQVTAAEKKLVELYREADSDTKKAAVSLLKGEQTGISDVLSSLLNGKTDSSDMLGSLLGGAAELLGKK